MTRSESDESTEYHRRSDGLVSEAAWQQTNLERRGLELEDELEDKWRRPKLYRDKVHVSNLPDTSKAIALFLHRTGTNGKPEPFRGQSPTWRERPVSRVRIAANISEVFLL